MKANRLLLLVGFLFVTGMAQADSFIRVINNSSQQLQAIWQAQGCDDVAYDWEGDPQRTVCKEKVLNPGDDVKYDFNLFLADRSVKVFKTGGRRIGYCNSMDYSSITIFDDVGSETGFKVETFCP